MTSEKEIIEEAVRRLITKHYEDYENILNKVRKEVRKHGGILK